MIGSTIYSNHKTRPDISFTVTILSQFLTNPSTAHLTAAKHLYYYITGTLNYGLEYQQAGALQGYMDADWAGSTSASDGRRSTSIYIFILANGPVSWSSKRQTTVALSSCKAEYIGKCNGVKEAVWLRLLLKEIGFEINDPTTIYMDNQSAIALASNPEYHAHIKHINIQYHYI